MKALSRLTMSLALVGLACTEPVMAGADNSITTKADVSHILHQQEMDTKVLAFSDRSAGTPRFLTTKPAWPTATNKGSVFRFNEANATINTLADNGQSAPPPTDDGQSAPPPSDDGQSAPPPPDDGQNTPSSNDDGGGGIKWAPQTSDEGMSL